MILTQDGGRECGQCEYDGCFEHAECLIEARLEGRQVDPLQSSRFELMGASPWTGRPIYMYLVGRHEPRCLTGRRAPTCREEGTKVRTQPLVAARGHQLASGRIG